MLTISKCFSTEYINSPIYEEVLSNTQCHVMEMIHDEAGIAVTTVAWGFKKPGPYSHYTQKQRQVVRELTEQVIWGRECLQDISQEDPCSHKRLIHIDHIRTKAGAHPSEKKVISNRENGDLKAHTVLAFRWTEKSYTTIEDDKTQKWAKEGSDNPQARKLTH